MGITPLQGEVRMIRDAIGNELQVGDTVHAAGPNGTWILGIILKMQQGGVSFISNPSMKNGQPQQTPDILMLQVVCVLEGPSGVPHQSVIKVVAKNMVEQVVESSVTM